MGSGTSRMGLSPSHLATPSSPRRRRASIGRTLSSIFVCGAASGEMEDYPSELMVDSVEHDDQQKLDMSPGCGADPISTKTAYGGSSGADLDCNLVHEAQESNVEHDNREDCTLENTEVVEDNTHQPPSSIVSITEIVNLDEAEDMDSSPSEGSSHSRAESSTESNISEAIDFFSSEHSSTASDSSPNNFLLESESIQNRQNGSQVSGDFSISLNISSSNYSQMNTRESRRSGRRLFRDAFLRHNNRRRTDSRSFGFSFNESDNSRPDNWRHHDLTGDFFSGREGDIRSRRNRNQGSNQPWWNMTSEMLDGLDRRFDSIDNQTGVCPRGIHANGSCSCLSISAAEESAARAGISRVVLLAEALLEVLDQIYRQPLMISLPTISLPAPDSIVDSFPVKIYRQSENMDCESEVLQCYICLDEYEEGDKIRVLPCLHEYHMSCVDKWLKEVHGVCPLCRRNVCEGLTGSSVSNEDDDVS